MKIKRKLKKIIILSGTVFLLCTAMTACGSKPETNETAENGSDSSGDAKPADPVSENPEGNAQDSNADAENSQDTDTPASEPTANKDSNKNDNTDNGNSRWHVLDPETAKLVDADFEGNVEKIEENAFFISETETEILEDGTMMASSAVGTEIDGSDLLKVIYDDNTRFYTRTIYNGGESYEDNEAGVDSLELKDSVALKGIIKDDIFYADEIRIAKFK